jgi:septum formation protein
MINKIALASKSPRRQELLARLGINFSVIANNVEEVRRPEEPPEDYVVRLAGEKAFTGATQSGLLTIGSDTLGVIDHQVLEKPIDKQDAFRMWQLMSGREHTILSCVAVSNGKETRSTLVTSLVTFDRISQAEMDAYWATGEPCDKAGGYGIQGVGGTFVTHLNGSYDAVMGLPLNATAKLLRQFGVTVLGTNE